MSVHTPIKKQEQARVPYNQNVKSEDKPADADTKPAEPANPEQPEAK